MAMAYRMAPAVGALQALLDRRQKLVGDGGDLRMAGRFDGGGANDHAARPVRRRGVEIDRGRVDLDQSLRDGARPAQDRLEAVDAPGAVETQRGDVELLLVAERRIEAGAVEAASGGQLVERGAGEARRSPRQWASKWPSASAARRRVILSAAKDLMLSQAAIDRKSTR